MEGPTLHHAQDPPPPQEAEAEEEAEEEEAEEEVVEEVEHPSNPPIREMSESKEHYRRNSREIAPKQKNSSKTCEAVTGAGLDSEQTWIRHL